MQSATSSSVCALGAHPVRQQRTRSQAARCGGRGLEGKEQPRRAVLSLLGLGLALSSSGAAQADEPIPYKFPCGFDSPCIPPPPNGEARYIMPANQYDPAAAAVERLKAKLAAAKQAEGKPAAQE
jgi:hypothetical protein